VEGIGRGAQQLVPEFLGRGQATPQIEVFALVLVGRNTPKTRTYVKEKKCMDKPCKTLGDTFLGAINGTTSLPSPSENHGIRITLRVHSAKLPSSSKDSAKVVTFWGQNFTIAELCMCMDYSPPLDGQIPLALELPLVSSGDYFLRSLGVHRCAGCKKMRPSHITAVSTSPKV